MSRSRRKTPYVTDGQDSRTGRARKARTCANRVVRQYKKELPDGCVYKRLSNSWDIRDYKFWCGENSGVDSPTLKKIKRK